MHDRRDQDRHIAYSTVAPEAFLSEPTVVIDKRSPAR
ncbi:hypothetical protein J3A78_007642 [Streptomyces sp. PvR006]|nr:hypothetical protein [Streptomyces sp. PvR006]